MNDVPLSKRPDKILIDDEEARRQITRVESFFTAIMLLTRRIEAVEKKQRELEGLERRLTALQERLLK